MSTNDKKDSCHSGHGQHKGHGWMMVLCALLMIGGPLIALSSATDSLNFSLLSSALLPLILCLAMHGLMMKLMMPGNKKDPDSAKDETPQEIEAKIANQKTESDKGFTA
jgi:hypothetical protein